MSYIIKTGLTAMDQPTVVALLQGTYWAGTRPAETIVASLQRSDCYGAFDAGTGEQVGFARVVTDRTTFFWLADVVVDPRYRGQGIGKLLMQAVAGQAGYVDMRGMLKTRDAHGLYERMGFIRLDEKTMEKPAGVQLPVTETG